MEFAAFTSGVEGRDEEGPWDPGDAGSPILLLPLPPAFTGLDKQERVPVPKGALWGDGVGPGGRDGGRGLPSN